MLQQLAKSITPVVALLWNEKELVDELTELGFEVHLFPPFKLSARYSSHRNKINLWYKKFRIKTPSFKIQESYLASNNANAKRKLVRTLRTFYYEARFAVQPTYANKLIGQEETLVQTEPAFRSFSEWLGTLNVDGLFSVTPFLGEVDLVARILQQQHKPVIASIHSFDNVTKRGWQSVVSDHYIVWNKYNKEELERIHPSITNKNRITIAGAPQFDFHFNKDFIWSGNEWRTRLNIPAGKKVILYAGGPVALLPDEPQYLLALKQAYDQKILPADSVVLFRCHPLDRVERWKEYVGESENIIYDSAPNGKERLDYVNVHNDDIRKLVSTLKHCSVHVNVVSTMAVDGSVFNKPQIGPYYDEVNAGNESLFRKMYQQEHYIPILKSGVLNLAHTKKHFIELVNNCLQRPDDYNTNCSKCVAEIITYADGQSANRAVNAIENFFTA